MPYTSEKPKKVGSYTKPKKPKDLPKAPVTRLTASDMFNPSLATKNDIVPRLPWNDTFGMDPRNPGGIGPGGTYTTAGPAPTNERYVPPENVRPTTSTPGTPGTGATTGAGASSGAPGGYSDAAYLSGFLNEHPEVIAADTLAGMGITNMDMIGMLTDLVGAGPAMYLLTQGATPEGFATGSGEELGFLTDFAGGLMDPGGSGFTLDSLMGSILNADPASPLGAFLATGGPAAVSDLVRAAAMMGTGNPYFQQAIDKNLGRLDLDYARDFAHGAVQDDDAYIQAIRNSPLGVYF